MSYDKYLLIKLTFGVLATVGLYSVLYKENKLYRFFEHVFLGLAVGYALVALWAETLYDLGHPRRSRLLDVDHLVAVRSDGLPCFQQEA